MSTAKPILAFLQNQWFQNPDRVAAIYARTTTLEGRAKLNRAFLFYRSLTGRRLRAAFGARCDDIIWEECSRSVGSRSSAAFPADLDHMRESIRHFRPRLILTFGRIATDAIKAIAPACEVISGPHPAARHATVPQELADMSGITLLALSDAGDGSSGEGG